MAISNYLISKSPDEIYPLQAASAFSAYTLGSQILHYSDNVYYESNNQRNLRIELSVRAAWKNMDLTQRRVRYLKDYHYAVQKTLMTDKEQFNLDQDNLLKLLDLQNEYLRVNLELLDAEYAEILSKFKLLSRIGQLVNYTEAIVPFSERDNN